MKWLHLGDKAQDEGAFNTEVLLMFQGVGVSGWLVVGEGLPAVRVLPVQQCQKHCSSFNLWLSSGDMGKGLLGDRGLLHSPLRHTTAFLSEPALTSLKNLSYSSFSLGWDHRGQLWHH